MFISLSTVYPLFIPVLSLSTPTYHLSLLVYICLSLSLFSSCLHLYPPVFSYLSSLYPSVYPHIPLSIPIYRCLLLSNPVIPCPPLPTPCLSLSPKQLLLSLLIPGRGWFLSSSVFHALNIDQHRHIIVLLDKQQSSVWKVFALE